MRRPRSHGRFVRRLAALPRRNALSATKPKKDTASEHDETHRPRAGSWTRSAGERVGIRNGWGNAARWGVRSGSCAAMFRPLYFLAFINDAKANERWRGLDDLRAQIERFRSQAIAVGIGIHMSWSADLHTRPLP